MFESEARFEWDPVKDEINFQKHGIRFRQAIQVFQDPLCITKFDRVQDGEQRWHAIGVILNFVCVLVVHTERQGEDDERIIRIISARKLDRKEQRLYEYGQG